MRIVIVGAGMAGVSAACWLSRSLRAEIILLDERPPLSLTSNHSTECYRHWWPNAPMQALSGHSIGLLEQLANACGNRFHMNRRGYLYLTANPQTAAALRAQAESQTAAQGWPLRVHTAEDDTWQPSSGKDWRDAPEGVDLLWGNEVIARHFPALAADTLTGLHVRRAGWLSAQQLGRTLLEEAAERGVRLPRGLLTTVETSNGRITGIRLADGQALGCDVLVNAAGPFLQAVNRLAGDDSLPVHTELHLKNAFRDTRGVLPRNAPLLIWLDSQHLPWTEEERALLAEDPQLAWLLETLPGGVHTRPEGDEESPIALHLWEYRTLVMPPQFPIPLDDLYPDIVLRGLSRMLPGLRDYFQAAPRPQMDGGYYTRTPENLPLIGPHGPQGLFLLGALSGYGIMTGYGAGELLTRHITGQPLPEYARWFHPNRYHDPQLAPQLAQMRSGQL